VHSTGFSAGVGVWRLVSGAPVMLFVGLKAQIILSANWRKRLGSDKSIDRQRPERAIY